MRTLSKTVWDFQSRMFWKVRAMPSFVISSGVGARTWAEKAWASRAFSPSRQALKASPERASSGAYSAVYMPPCLPL